MKERIVERDMKYNWRSVSYLNAHYEELQRC